MINPLANVPFNEKNVYVMAEAPCGCEIYMPVDSFCDFTIGLKKTQLAEYLKAIYPHDIIPPTDNAA